MRHRDVNEVARSIIKHKSTRSESKTKHTEATKTKDKTIRSKKKYGTQNNVISESNAILRLLE